MRKNIPNLNEPHSPIVFSTNVPDHVFKAYSKWKISVCNGNNESKGASWISFCDECESAGLSPLTAVNMINK